MIVTERIERSCALVKIDRPAKRNSLTAEFWPLLTETLDELDADEEVAVVLLTGAGDRAFSAGGDIASFSELSTLEAVRAYEDVCFGAFRRLETFEKPTIAVVGGFALAGGCELAFACDIVVAADTASFGVPEVRVGLSAGYASVRFGESLGSHAVKSLTLTGRRVSAQEALALGLAQAVVPAPRALPLALALARELSALPRSAVGSAKQLIDRSRRAGDLDAVKDALAFLHLSQDKFEGVAAFLEGRAPNFAGR